MDAVILGSGSCAPTARRGSSGVLVYTAETTLLLDGGGAVVEKMVKTDRSYTDLDAVLYTHLHCDHTAGIIPLIFAINNTPGYAREKDLPIYGPAGFVEFVGRLPDLYPWMEPDGYGIVTVEVESSDFSVDDIRVRSEPVVHAGLECVGYRLEADGRVLAYSGDTDECDGLVELARGADVLIIECSHPDGMKLPGHLTPSFCGRIAERAGVGRVVLTHLYADCDEVDIAGQCKAAFSGEVIVAEDLMHMTV